MAGYGGIFGPLMQHAEEVGFERRQERAQDRRSQITDLQTKQQTILKNIGILEQQDQNDPEVQRRLQEANDAYNGYQQQLDALYGGPTRRRRGVTGQIWDEIPRGPTGQPIPLHPAPIPPPPAPRAPMSEQPPVTPQIPLQAGMTLDQITQAVMRLPSQHRTPIPMPAPLPPPQTTEQFMAEFRGPLSPAAPPEYYYGGGPEGPIGQALSVRAPIESPAINLAAPLASVTPEEASALPRATQAEWWQPTPTHRLSRRERLLGVGRGILAGVGRGVAGALGGGLDTSYRPTLTTRDPMSLAQLEAISPYESNPILQYTQWAADTIRRTEGREPTAEEWAQIHEYALGLGKAPPRTPTAKGAQVRYAPGGEVADVTLDGVTYSNAQVDAGTAPPEAIEAVKSARAAVEKGITQKEKAAQEREANTAERQAKAQYATFEESMMKGDIAQMRRDAQKPIQMARLLVPLYRAIIENQKAGKSIGDRELVLGWVKSQVTGVARMNETEIDKASNTGDWPQRVSTYYHMWKDGRMDDSVRAEMTENIRVAAQVWKNQADEFQREINEQEQRDIERAREIEAERTGTTATPQTARPNAGKYISRSAYEADHKDMTKEQVDAKMKKAEASGYTVEK